MRVAWAAASELAARLGVYPSSSTARMTRSRVDSRTLLVLLTTRDTVIGDTWAWAATSSIVTAWPLRRTDFRDFAFLTLLKARPSRCAVAAVAIENRRRAGRIVQGKSRQGIRRRHRKATRRKA